MTDLHAPSTIDDAPTRPSVHPAAVAGRPILAFALVAAGWAIGLIDSPLRSIGTVIALLSYLAALGVLLARSTQRVVLLAAAALFAPWLALRASPWLVWIDVAALAVLVLVAVATPDDGTLAVSLRRHGDRVVQAVGRAPGGAALLGHTLLRRAGHRLGTVDRVRPIAIAVAVGICSLVFGLAVLASGDALLASYLDVPLTPSWWLRAATAVAGVVAVLVTAGAAPVEPVEPQRLGTRRTLAPMSVELGLSGLALAIGAYSASQASAAFLGAEFVERRTGLTYADYARSGFFQLVGIAAIATAAIAISRPVAAQHRGAARPIRLAAGALTAGVVVTVVSAIVKLVVYADRFGLTMLRVYTVVFAAWLGLVAVLTFLASLRTRQGWLLPVVTTTAVIGAFAMNVADPESHVAGHNIDRALTTGTLDVDYLDRLSADAAPTILARLDELPPEVTAQLRARWCDAGSDDGGLSFNLAASRAADSAAAACN